MVEKVRIQNKAYFQVTGKLFLINSELLCYDFFLFGSPEKQNNVIKIPLHKVIQYGFKYYQNINVSLSPPHSHPHTFKTLSVSHAGTHLLSP